MRTDPTALTHLGRAIIADLEHARLSRLEACYRARPRLDPSWLSKAMTGKVAVGGNRLGRLARALKPDNPGPLLRRWLEAKAKDELEGDLEAQRLGGDAAGGPFPGRRSAALQAVWGGGLHDDRGGGAPGHRELVLALAARVEQLATEHREGMARLEARFEAVLAQVRQPAPEAEADPDRATSADNCASRLRPAARGRQIHRAPWVASVRSLTDGRYAMRLVGSVPTGGR